METLDVLVIGAGVVGLAAARALALEGRDVIVVDAGSFPGSGTSSRNSGVIHAGIYYPKGSNKAVHCLEGKKLLYNYIKEKGIPYENCQKLIVASNNEELGKLQNIRQKAEDNGVDDLRIICAEDAHVMEPELSCVGALLSPSTGIIDVHEYIQALIVDIEDSGGLIALQNNVSSGVVRADGIELTLSDGSEIKARIVVNAAGIGAQSVARKLYGFNSAHIPTQHLAKGNYFTISGRRPFDKLVYPVPVAGGLGAHYTRNMAGESLFGPDVEWIETCEHDKINYNVDAFRAEKFYGYIEKYWPAIRDRELLPAYAGVRPKLVEAGQPDGDFIIQGPTSHGVNGLVNLFGIESPGLTASLSIANEVAALLGSRPDEKN